MTNDSIGTNGFQPDAAADERLFDSWFDPIEHAVRDRVRFFIEEPRRPAPRRRAAKLVDEMIRLAT
jgi:hypothetical protein